MCQSRSSTGFFLSCCWPSLGMCCGRCRIGWSMAGRRPMRSIPWFGYLYLAVVGIGGLLLASLLIAILVHIWKNTRQKSADERRRNLSPSEMSAAERAEEIERQFGGRQANLPMAMWYRQSCERRSQSAVAEMESKRESQQLEIVAFGTISSGKSSLLNALAGRAAFRTNVVGGTTVTRSEIPWPAGDAWCWSIRRDWPRSAAKEERPSRQRRPKTPISCCSSSTGRSRSTRASCSKRSRRWRSGLSFVSTRKIGTTPISATSCLRQISEQVSARGRTRPMWWRCDRGRRRGGGFACCPMEASKPRKCRSSRISVRWRSR